MTATLGGLSAGTANVLARDPATAMYPPSGNPVHGLPEAGGGGRTRVGSMQGVGVLSAQTALGVQAGVLATIRIQVVALAAVGAAAALAVVVPQAPAIRGTQALGQMQPCLSKDNRI